MYAVFFRFVGAERMSGSLRSAHERWVEQSLHEGVLVVAGRSIRDSGFTMLVQGLGLEELQARLRVCPLAGTSNTRIEIQEVSPLVNETCLRLIEDSDASDADRLYGRSARSARSPFE